MGQKMGYSKSMLQYVPSSHKPHMVLSAKKALPTSFSHVISLDVEISPKNHLTFSFFPFATLIAFAIEIPELPNLVGGSTPPPPPPERGWGKHCLSRVYLCKVS